MCNGYIPNSWDMPRGWLLAIGEYVAISDEYGKYGNQRQLLYRRKHLYLETMHILYSITHIYHIFQIMIK